MLLGAAEILVKQRASFAGTVRLLFQPGEEGFGGARIMIAEDALKGVDAVFAAANHAGWPEEALHREYFVLPEEPARQSHAFVLRLATSGRDLQVAAGRSATDVLAGAGIVVPTKCSDGLCGVCAVAYDAAASSAVDHRDHVLSASARQTRVVLCCSRTLAEDGQLVLPGL